MPRQFHPFLSGLAQVCLCAALAFSAACNRGPAQSATKRYAFKGKVMSVDKNAATANIDNEPIAGFMESMVMPYAIKPAAMLSQLQPGDTITAEVVVQADNTYWLENVKVVGHSELVARPAAAAKIPSPGDDVPDFKLINQSGKA